MFHPWYQTQLRPAAAQLYLLSTGSLPSRESPSSCNKRLSVPFCPFSRKSFPLGRMRGAGWTWWALYGLGTGSRGSELKPSFRAFPSSLPRATEKERERNYQETILLYGFLHPQPTNNAENPFSTSTLCFPIF